MKLQHILIALALTIAVINASEIIAVYHLVNSGISQANKIIDQLKTKN